MTIHRRTVLKGVAWATPVVVAASAAPAIAASNLPTPQLFAHGKVARKSNAGATHLAYLEVDLSAYSGSASAPDPNLKGFTLTETVAGSPISDIRLTLWFTYSGLTFTLSAAATAAGWTTSTASVPGSPGSIPSGYTAYTFALTDRTSAATQTNWGATTTGASPDNLFASFTTTGTTHPYTTAGADQKFYATATSTYVTSAYTYESGQRGITLLPA